MADIFVSHVEEDAKVALEIAQGLEAAGYTVWYYERDSVPGLSYLVQTGQAIEQSRAVVLIISAHSLGSNQVSSEVVRAHEAGKPFIPVLSQVTHSQFQARQPLWRQAVGSASSIAIPPEGVAVIIPRIVGGLNALGIEGKSKGESREPSLAGVKSGVLSKARERQPEIMIVPRTETRLLWQNKWFWIVAVALVVQGIIITFLALRLSQLSGLITSLSPLVTPPTTLTPSAPSPTSVPKRNPTGASATMSISIATVTAALTRIFTPAPASTAMPEGMATPEPIKAYNLPLNDPTHVIYDGSALCVQFTSAQARLELVEGENRFRISEQECGWPQGKLVWDASRGQFWALDEDGIVLKDRTGATISFLRCRKHFLVTRRTLPGMDSTCGSLPLKAQYTSLGQRTIR